MSARDVASLALDHHAQCPDHGPGQDQGVAQLHDQGNGAKHDHPDLAHDPDPGRDQNRGQDPDLETIAKAQTRKGHDLTLAHRPALGLSHVTVHALGFRGQGHQEPLQDRINDSKTRTRQPGNRTTSDRARGQSLGTNPSHDHAHAHGRALDPDHAQGTDAPGHPETDQHLVNNPQVKWSSSNQRTMASAKKLTERLRKKALFLKAAMRPLPFQRGVTTNRRKSRQGPRRRRSRIRLNLHQRKPI